jgi:hypothetical protein
VTLPTDRLVLHRGRVFGDLREYATPHPVRHATVANLRLDAGDVAGAAALADELLAIAESDDGALYVPYLFPLTSRLESLESPWYSGMAQGKVLGLFARLYEATGEVRWLKAADATYQSLVRADPIRRVWHGEGGSYWIDTFSWAEPDPILNGMLYAIVGLDDYRRVTGSGEATLRDAIETIGTQGHRFMLPEGRTSYDLAGKGPAGRYYSEIVHEQMAALGPMAPCLQAAADSIFDPPPSAAEASPAPQD